MPRAHLGIVGPDRECSRDGKEGWAEADLFSGPAEAHVSGGAQLHYLLLRVHTQGELAVRNARLKSTACADWNAG